MYRTIDQLTEDELLELSDREGMTIDQLKDEFSSTLFVEEDFFVTFNRIKNQHSIVYKGGVSIFRHPP